MPVVKRLDCLRIYLDVYNSIAFKILTMRFLVNVKPLFFAIALVNQMLSFSIIFVLIMIRSKSSFQMYKF